MNEILSEKYRPTKKEEWIGPSYPINQVLRHVGLFLEGNPVFRCIILVGAPGTGKTTLGYLAGNHHKLNVVEINASDQRNKDDINRLWKSASTKGIECDRNLILVDEADGLSKTMQTRIAKLISTTASPIVICANYEYKLIKEVRKKCLVIKFDNPTTEDIYELLLKVSRAEGVQLSRVVLMKISVMANNYRNALQLLSMAIMDESLEGITRDRQIGDLSQQINDILDGNPPEYFGVDPNTLSTWIMENTLDVQMVADADTFLRLIKEDKSLYRYWRYAYEIMSCCRHRRSPDLRLPFSMMSFRKPRKERPKKEERIKDDSNRIRKASKQPTSKTHNLSNWF